MAELKYSVKYISNTCSQTDELLNQPHQSVAESLFDLLKNHNEIQHPVIGLEGSWGSGKSQVIGILQKIIKDKQFASKYKFLTYDIWSAQEDLTRRSFLDSVLSEVKEDDSHFNTDQLRKDYEKLNATTTIRSTKSFPLVRLFFACILLIPVANFIVSSIETAFGYCEKASMTYDQLRGLLSFVLCVLSLLAFVIAYIEEFQEVNSDNDVKKKSTWEKFQIVIGRLFYVFKAKDVEKRDYETIMKDEPSISRFQSIFDHVYKALKGDSVLVIVFDNMDRLSDSQKLMSTWSLLHTFFAEKQYEGKVWALVPYAKQQLSELMKGNSGNEVNASEFINKTFFTTFRIPEPIMGSWKNFLSNKLDLAFTPHLDEEDKNYVTLIFSRSMGGRAIRPRDIIAFINRLVALYSQHHFEDVPMRFIVLYAQYESSISLKPIESILNFEGFESMVPLVGKDDLSRWLSSIYYNLPSETALEVVYDREIQNFLQCDYEVIDGTDEAKEAYLSLSSNDLFHHHIEEYFNKDVTLADHKLENVFYLLSQDNISQGTRNRIFSSISDQLDALKDQLSEYAAWMEYAFLIYDIQVTNKIIRSLIANAKQSFDTRYRTIVPLLQLQKRRSGIIVKFDAYKTESAKDMLEYYDYLVEEGASEYFKQAKIELDSSKLLEYMKEGVAGNLLFGNNTDKVYGLLNLMKKSKHDLKPIAKYITEASINIVSQEHIQVERIYRVYNIVTENSSNIPPYTLIGANGTKFLDIPEYLACTLVQLKNKGFNNAQINNCLSTSLIADVNKVNAILPRYFYFDTLIKISLASGNTMLCEICRSLASAKVGSINSADEIFSSSTKIIENIFGGDEELFLSYLDTKVNVLKEKTKTQFVEVDAYWRDRISVGSIQKHAVFKFVCDQWLAEFSDFIDSTWCDEFTTPNGEVSLILLKLDEIGIIGKDFWRDIPTEQIKKAFSDCVVNGTSFDFILFEKWKQQQTKATLAKLANDTFYEISNPKSIKELNFIYFVELLWENSELIRSYSHANAIYDDYVSDYLSKNAPEHICSFIYNHKSQVELLLDYISQDRKEQIIVKFSQLNDNAQEGSRVRVILENLIEKYALTNEEGAK